jgi:hypothetical protein
MAIPSNNEINKQIIIDLIKLLWLYQILRISENFLFAKFK